MTNLAYQNFQKTIDSFYQKAIKEHSLKFTLKNRFKALKERVEREQDLMPEIQLRSLPPKTKSQNENKEPQTQFVSLGLTQPKDLHPLSITKSRSILERSRGSSKDVTQKGLKMFNCQWLFESEQSSKTLFYGIMLAFVMNDNKLSFKYFEDKINDELNQSKNFNEYQLSTIARQWQLIGMLLLKSKPMKWKQSLKEAVNKLPLKFTKLACKTMLSLSETASDLCSVDILVKLSKEMKITVSFFTITYKEIESVETIGKVGQQICIGKLKHKNHYVVSNQLPQYSEEDKILREIRANFATSVSELLNEYSANTEAIEIEGNSKALKQKDTIAREFLTNCLRQ